MSSLFVIAIPMVLIIIGILLNSFHIVHDQPTFSFEEDPTHKLAAERQANYHFFQLQRQRLLRRQKRVGQYGWLVLAVSVGSSWFLYSDAVRTTTVSKQISSIQTFAVADSKDGVLSLTLKRHFGIADIDCRSRARQFPSDGSTVKYVVKPSKPYTAQSPKRAEHAAEILQNCGMALRISN